MYPTVKESYGVKSVHIKDIQHPKVWINMRGRVIQLWESGSDAISQVGLLADETGRIKFVSWKKSDLPLMEENRTYLIKTVVVDSWNDKLQVNLNKTSKIIPLEEDIEIDFNSEIEGVVTDIIPESGLIVRCPECRRVLVDGVCMVHGEVEPVLDLRIKAAFDTGQSSEIIVLNRNLTEGLIGISLDEAKELSKEDLEKRVKEKIVDSRFRVVGSKPSNYFIVGKIKPVKK